jgi:uncharacterized protein (TIGR00303 family)
MPPSPCRFIHRPIQGQIFLDRLRQLQPAFALVVAHTDTVALPGLSAAGATEDLRLLTAAADAEILAHGRARCLETGVPSHPSGIPGPSILVRAAFDQLPGLPFRCIDAGLHRSPDVPVLHRLFAATPAQAVSTGAALPRAIVEALIHEAYALGQTWGRQYQAEHCYLILAESVPGGTTTALGLLLGLGVNAIGKVSSSIPGGADRLKLLAIAQGLGGRSFREDPIGAVAAMGDGMQPVVAAIALGAAAFCPVVLGGGTQMAAVLAFLGVGLEQGIFGDVPMDWDRLNQNLGLVTTRWVSEDGASDLAGLGLAIEAACPLLEVPYLALNLRLSRSRYAALRSYEQGFVKEGVGAGAALMAACLVLGCATDDLVGPIETVYERLVLKESGF